MWTVGSLVVRAQDFKVEGREFEPLPLEVEDQHLVRKAF